MEGFLGDQKHKWGFGALGRGGIFGTKNQRAHSTPSVRNRSLHDVKIPVRISGVLIH